MGPVRSGWQPQSRCATRGGSGGRIARRQEGRAKGAARMGFLATGIAWLRAGYPDSAPGLGYVPLLALFGSQRTALVITTLLFVLTVRSARFGPYDDAFSSPARANCSRSAPAMAARAATASRVVRGRYTSPAAKPVATHTLVQNGQVTSSPTAF